MRLWLSFLAAGVLAALPLTAQHVHRGQYGGHFPRVPTVQPTPGSGLNGLPGFQKPNLGLNGVPGIHTGISVNGLPAFSNRYAHYPCAGCSPFHNGNRRSGRGGYGYGGYAVTGFVPLFDSYSFDSTFDSGQAAPAEGPVMDPNAISMAEEIGELRGELNSLKSQAAEQAEQAGNAPAPGEPVTAAPEPTEPATVIVLRNGRQLETTNYAVMDQTLWNFSAKPLQKIPLSSIDMAASAKANATRGVDFSAAAETNN